MEVGISGLRRRWDVVVMVVLHAGSGCPSAGQGLASNNSAAAGNTPQRSPGPGHQAQRVPQARRMTHDGTRGDDPDGGETPQVAWASYSLVVVVVVVGEDLEPVGGRAMRGSADPRGLFRVDGVGLAAAGSHVVLVHI